MGWMKAGGTVGPMLETRRPGCFGIAAARWELVGATGFGVRANWSGGQRPHPSGPRSAGNSRQTLDHNRGSTPRMRISVIAASQKRTHGASKQMFVRTINPAPKASASIGYYFRTL